MVIYIDGFLDFIGHVEALKNCQKRMGTYLIVEFTTMKWSIWLKGRHLPIMNNTKVLSVFSV